MAGLASEPEAEYELQRGPDDPLMLDDGLRVTVRRAAAAAGRSSP
jgi:hypothetical protein